MWKEILKEESEYLEGQFLEEAKKDYEMFLRNYQTAKSMTENMKKKYAQIVELLGDAPSGRLKESILETLGRNEIVSGDSYEDVKSAMIRTHGDFENGDASSTRLAGEVFEKMDRMMDIIWYFERDL